MPKVVLKENEVLDDALRRFKRQVSRNGTLAEARKREFYVKPGLKRKLKYQPISGEITTCKLFNELQVNTFYSIPELIKKLRGNDNVF